MIIESDLENRLVSYDGEMPYDNYIKIENSNISAMDAARMIKERFEL